MSEFNLSNMSEQEAEKYQSPYAQQAREKSSELGRGSDNYPYTIDTTMYGHKVELNGMKHTNDPGNKSVERLKAQFDEFINTARTPLVFVEGGMREDVVADMDSDSSLRKHGEPGLITKLAQEQNIEVRSPEPLDAELIDQLLKKFSAEEVAQYLFERRLYQWYRMKDLDQNIGDREQYLRAGLLDKVSEAKGLEAVPTDYDYYIDKVESRFGDSLDDLKDDVIRERLNYDVSPFGNQVSAFTSDFRDKYLMTRIKEAARDGRDVFVVYGSHHIFVLEQMLKNGIT